MDLWTNANEKEEKTRLSFGRINARKILTSEIFSLASFKVLILSISFLILSSSVELICFLFMRSTSSDWCCCFFYENLFIKIQIKTWTFDVLSKRKTLYSYVRSVTAIVVMSQYVRFSLIWQPWWIFVYVELTVHSGGDFLLRISNNTRMSLKIHLVLVFKFMVILGLIDFYCEWYNT